MHMATPLAIPIAARMPSEILGAILLMVKRPERRLLTYSLVCNHWCEVVAATHALWSTIRVSVDGPDVTPAFEKSGTHFLDVSIIDPRTQEEAQLRGEPNGEAFLRAVELLRENFGRVRMLEIRSVNDPFLEMILASFLRDGDTLDAPVIEELVIAAPEDHPVVNEGPDFSEIPSIDALFRVSSVPRLTHLTLAAPFDDPESVSTLTNITHLTIDRGTDSNAMYMEAYYSLIRAVAPKLQELVYRGYEAYSSQGGADDEIIEMPSLRRLKMWAPSAGFEIVPALRMPNLEELWLSDERPDDFADQWAHDEVHLVSEQLLLIRSRCLFLRRIELVNLSFLPLTTQRALFCTSNSIAHDKLEELVIHKGTLTDESLDDSGLAFPLSFKRWELREVSGISASAFKLFLSCGLRWGNKSSGPLEVVVVNCEHITPNDFDSAFNEEFKDKIVVRFTDAESG